MTILKTPRDDGSSARRTPALSGLIVLIMALLSLSACGGNNDMLVPGETKEPTTEADATSDDDDVSQAESPDEDLVDFAMAISGEVCGKMFECCTPDERSNKLGMTSETAEQCADQSGFLGFAFGYGQFDDSIKAGRIVVDTGMADLCLQAINETACADFSALSSVDRFVPGCRAVFAPQVDEGGTCTLDQECKSGVCLTDDDSSEATCGPLPTDGEPCPEYRCAESLYCDAFLHAQPTCLPQRELGESCGDSAECVSEYCASDSNGDLVCQNKSAVCLGG